MLSCSPKGVFVLRTWQEKPLKAQSKTKYSTNTNININSKQINKNLMCIIWGIKILKVYIARYH